MSEWVPSNTNESLEEGSEAEDEDEEEPPSRLRKLMMWLPVMISLTADLSPVDVRRLRRRYPSRKLG